MRKNVSPVFAVIVVLIAIAIGALSFFWRLRSYDAARAEEAKMLQAQADAQRMTQIRNGTYGMMQSRKGMRAARRGGRSGMSKEAAPGGPMKPGVAGQGPGASNGKGQPSQAEGGAKPKTEPAAKAAAGRSQK